MHKKQIALKITIKLPVGYKSPLGDNFNSES